LVSKRFACLVRTVQWAGININAISYVGLALSIGLLVDFVMHILLRYYEVKGNRREKTVEMLRTMGSSILVGGISTFLGTVPLALASSRIFYTIFVTFLGIVTIGMGHGLILLPVILSTVGPEDVVETNPPTAASSVRSTSSSSSSDGCDSPGTRLDKEAKKAGLYDTLVIEGQRMKGLFFDI